MDKGTLVRCAALVSMIAAAVFPASAAAGSFTASYAPPLSACPKPVVEKPFLEFGDSNNYVLAPNGKFDRSAAQSGWQLSGGAQITTATQSDGSSGGVLQLPSWSVATSPVFCVTADYPTARMQVRHLAGRDAVFFLVSYWDDDEEEWSRPRPTGWFHGPSHAGWGLSKELAVKPALTPGWQQVRFSFFTVGGKGRVQVDDFWVDPRASR